MRLVHEVGPARSWCWEALRPWPDLLYRRVADQDLELLAVGVREECTVDDAALIRSSGATLAKRLAGFGGGDWVFGHLAYDAKNGLEALTTAAPNTTTLPDLRLVVPRWVVERRAGWDRTHVHLEDLEQAVLFYKSLTISNNNSAERERIPTTWQLPDRVSYLRRTAGLMAHIQQGDIYEVNYCLERSTQLETWDPFRAFPALLQATDAPFAAFHRAGSQFTLCASPERFLRFEKGSVVAQPMKGTRRRHPDPIVDRQLAVDLSEDPKERAENVMAVDVMRHDLSRVAATAGVQVEELCAVRSYPGVHQMISTIYARLDDRYGPWDALLAAFPPASMTGAPKIRAMQLIDEAENMRRGLYAGTLGYLAPDGSGDFNVVIRTLTYHADIGRLSLMTGSALTAASDPLQEWEECNLKATTVLNAFGP